MADIFNMTDTWNDGAIVFNAVKMAVTNTASNAASKLIDIQDVTNGTGFIVDAATGATTFDFGANNITLTLGGWPRITSSSNLYLSVNGATSRALVRSSDFTILGAPLAWASSGVTADLFLYQDAANQLALRNGLNAQSFSIYETYTDGSNYSKLKISYDSGNSLFSLAGVASGTGTARRVRLVFGANWAQIESGAFSINGACRPAASSLYDLGSSSNRWRDVYLSPSSSLTPANNGDLCIEATDNTTLTFKYKGSDGTVRSGTVALS